MAQIAWDQEYINNNDVIFHSLSEYCIVHYKTMIIIIVRKVANSKIMAQLTIIIIASNIVHTISISLHLHVQLTYIAIII